MKKLMTTAVACLALTHSASIASAQPKQGKRKSASTATALAVAGTLLPTGLMVVGIGTDQPALTVVAATSTLFAPSIGHFYAEGGLTGTTGMALRGVAMFAGFAGVAVFAEGACSSRYNIECNNNDDETLLYAGIGLMGASAVTYVAGTIWDIATAGKAAERANERNGLTISVAPVVMPRANGGMTGLALSGTF